MMAIKYFEIDLDIKDPLIKMVPYIEVVSGDTDTNIFNIQLFENYIPVNASGHTAVITFGKPDKTTVFQNLIPVDVTKGKYTCTLSSQTIVVPGTVKAEVSLYEGTKRLTSTRFQFIVRKAILDENTVESSNEFSALTEALSTVNQYDNRITSVEDTLGSHLEDYATFKNNTNAEIVEIKKKIGIVHNIESWAEVQAIVRAGIADQVFKVGDMLVSEYNGKEVIWIIIGIDHDTPTNTEYIHSLTIQTRDCLANIQFDAPEPTNPDTNRQQYGNNRYIHSAIRQWLNSNDDVFQWVPQHEYDAAPTGAIYGGPGFLKLLDPELVAVIGAVDKQVARNTVTDAGGQDTFSDKVFLLSRVEAGLGTEGTTDGEEVYSYYDGIENAGRIKLLNGSPRSWWLRSPNVSLAFTARNVNTLGEVIGSGASASLGLAPACCII